MLVVIVDANPYEDMLCQQTLPGRLELPTLRLTASRSNQLSYGSRCNRNVATPDHTAEGIEDNAGKNEHQHMQRLVHDPLIA